MVTRQLRLFALLLCLHFGGAASAQPQENEFSVDDYFLLRRVVELVLSPGGEYVAFVVEGSSLNEAGPKKSVFIQHTSGSSPTHLAEVDGASKLAWMPRSRRLSFILTRDGKAQVHSFDVRNGDLQQHSRAADSVAQFAFSPDESMLAYTTAPSSEQRSLYDQVREEGGPVTIDPDITSAFDFIDPSAPAPTKVVRNSRKLWLSNATHDEPASEIVVAGDVSQFYWSSDGRWLSVTYVADAVPARVTRKHRSSIGVLDVASMRLSLLLSASDGPPIGYIGGEWLPDEARFVVRRANLTNAWVGKQYLEWAIIGAEGVPDPTTTKWHTMESYDARVVAATSSKLLVENTHRAARGLFELTPAGAERAHVGKSLRGNVSLVALSADRSKAAFVHQSLSKPPEIYLQDGSGHPRRITDLNSALLKKTMPNVKAVAWRSTDGAEVSGWLFLPSSSQAAKPWPLVTFVHGGPGYVFADEYAPYFRLWPYPLEVLPSYGIAVLVPNYRGTHSFGMSFSSPTRIDKEPIEDILSGIQNLVADRIADPDRLAVCGHSHGAWLGSMVTTRLKDLRATSFAEGLPNMVVAYESFSQQLNRDVYDAQVGASLYEDPLRYVEISPSLHMRGLKSANLFEGGAYAGAMLMLPFAKASSRANLPTELLIYPRSGHNLTDPKLQRESARRNLEWFQRWLHRR